MERFTPFLAFPPELRRVIYTTNSIESLNYQLRKITQEPRPLPQRSRGRQAALAGDLRHRRQIERATGRKSEVSAPSNAKHPDASSRARPRRTGNRHCNNSHWGLPRPHQPPPLTTMTANAHTKNLTGSPAARHRWACSMSVASNRRDRTDSALTTSRAGVSSTTSTSHTSKTRATADHHHPLGRC